MDTLPSASRTPSRQRRYSRAYVTRILDLSDTADAYLARISELERQLAAAWRAGFGRGYRAGYCRQFGDSVPDDPLTAEAAVRAAEHQAAQQAAEWQRAFLRQAAATPAGNRSEPQAAALAMLGAWA